MARLSTVLAAALCDLACDMGSSDNPLHRGVLLIACCYCHGHRCGSLAPVPATALTSQPGLLPGSASLRTTAQPSPTAAAAAHAPVDARRPPRGEHAATGSARAAASQRSS